LDHKRASLARERTLLFCWDNKKPIKKQLKECKRKKVKVEQKYAWPKKVWFFFSNFAKQKKNQLELLLVYGKMVTIVASFQEEKADLRSYLPLSRVLEENFSRTDVLRTKNK